MRPFLAAERQRKVIPGFQVFQYFAQQQFPLTTVGIKQILIYLS